MNNNIQKSPGFINSTTTSITTEIFKDTHQSQTELKILEHIRIALVEGIQHLDEWDDLMDGIDYVMIIEEILDQLVGRNGSTFIEFSSGELKLHLSEVDDFILITVNSKTSMLTDSSFELLVQSIIRNIVCWPRYYSYQAINYALDYVLSKPVTSGLQHVAACYVAKRYRSEINQSVVFMAANHIFAYPANYDCSCTQKIAINVIYNSDNCGHLNVIEAAQYILMHQKHYGSISIVSASLIVFVNNASCTHDLLTLAARDMLDNEQNYPDQFIADAALIVINNDREFFRSPHRSTQGQRNFVKFFESKEALEILTSYSDGLREALCAVNEIIRVTDGDARVGRVVNVKKLSMEGAWMDGYFHLVFERNIGVAFFILENINHEVLRLWRSEKGESDSDQSK